MIASQMIIRKYNPADVEQIQAIYDKHHHGQFGVPNLHKVISSVVVEHNNKIIAYGALEKILEGMMILDLSLPNKIKLEALSHVIDSGRVAARLNNYERFYSFPRPESFAQLLVKHFEFESCDSIFHLEL